jgi:hypothetical protein
MSESKLTITNIYEKVTKTEEGCWEWNGTVSKSGYAYTQGSPAHRVVFQLFNGPISKLPGHHGGVVRHSCDNRKCVNPEHLKLGTTRDNLQDQIDRGSVETGTRCSIKGKRVLTNAEVVEVKQLREDGWTYTRIAEKFDMACGSIHEIINGRNKKAKPAEGKRKYRSLAKRTSFDTSVNTDVMANRANSLDRDAEALDQQVLELESRICEIKAQAKIFRKAADNLRAFQSTTLKLTP